MILLLCFSFVFNVFSEKAVAESSEDQVIGSIFKLTGDILFSSIPLSVLNEKISDSKGQKGKTLLNPSSRDESKNQATKKQTKKLASKPANKKRKPAGATISCSETFTDKYSVGYIRVGYTCKSNETLCIAVYEVVRNKCDGDNLTRYYCDEDEIGMVSSETIKCPHGCHFVGRSGRCIVEEM